MQYSFPYEQMMRDLISAMPKYTPPSEEELLRQAQRYAELQINPQLEALERAWQLLQQQTEAQKKYIEATYAGLEENVQNRLQELARQALENAIARGGGRSGVVEWLMQQYQKPVVEEYAKAQAEKAATLSDLANRLALAQQQYEEQRQQLAQRLGELQAQRLEELRNLAHATAMGDWETAFQAAQNLASMASSAQRSVLEFITSALPYYTMTEEARQTLPLKWAEAVGEVPPSVQQVYTGGVSAVPLRDYATKMGATVDYDPATGDVIINGRRYSPNVLSQVFGGKLVDGRWWLPESAMKTLLSF